MDITSGLARWRTRAAAAGVAAAVLFAGAPLLAHAATTRTATCGTSNDAAAIQAAIDQSADGDTVEIAGTCDLSSLPAHGGTVWSITDAAIVVDKAITITSAGTSRSAVLEGSGNQAAILVAPSGDGATIKGLTFRQLGRAVVVWNASNVTIGSTGGLNNPNANRISGGPTMNQAILALNNHIGAGETHGSAKVTVAGRNGQQETFALAGENLTNLKVLGNYISYAPAGLPDPRAYDIVAIDVRQRTAGADGISIRANAVGMGTSEFPSVNMNGVRVFAHSLEAIKNVTVDGNNLGRIEELAGTPADPAADVQAAGRVGILLHRVQNFTANGNGVRVRLSPTGVPMPGGGIVAADSSNGHIDGNGIISLADPSTADADLGAIGVIDQFADLFGNRADTLPTADIGIEGNIIGLVDSESPGLGAQKGIVLNGVTRPFVTGNTIKFSSLDAIHLGTAASGPGDPTVSPGLKTVKGTVREGIICRNFLDASGDDDFSYDFAGEVTADAVEGSAFPGGYSTVNSDCFPRMSLNPSVGPIQQNQDLVVTVAALPNYDIFVNLHDEDFGHTGATPNIVKNAHVGPTGRVDITYTAAELQTQVDGLLTVSAFLDFDDVYFQDSKTITLSAHPTDLPAGTVTLNDGPDAFTNAAEAHSNIPVTWTKANDSRVTGAKVWFADADGVTPSNCGPAFTSPTNSGYLAAACADQLPEGPYTFNVEWTGTGGLTSSRVSVLSVKDTLVSAPVITTPAPDFVSGVDTVSVSGSGDPGDAVDVTVGEVTNTVAVDGSGAWTTQFTLADGLYSVSATATDAAGNTAAGDAVDFKVITAGSTPDAPVITSPANGSELPGSVTVVGTAAPDTTVIATIGGIEWRRTVVSAAGDWGLAGPLPDGTHTLSITAADNVERTSPAATLTINVDGTRPTVAVDGSELIVLADGAVLSGTAADNSKVASVKIQLTNAITGTNVGGLIDATCTGCGTGAATWTATVTAPAGAYTAIVASIDAVGNVSSYARTTFVLAG